MYPFEQFVTTDREIYVSGHIAKRDGKPWVGKLGADMTTEEGKEAARAVAIDLLKTLETAAGGLDRIKRLRKLLVLVNATDSFIEPHLVANGASEHFLEVLGERGKHARSAVCVAQLPFGVCVEIELIAEV
jgi:enamine deaminase RidA (YjgF/YER057c/UK114 family)